ncbi:MAG: hypothetical protein ACLUDU_04160 [Butyricimonas faecihominis]
MDLSLALTPIKTEDFEWRVSFNTSKVYNEVSTTAEQSVTYEQYLNGSLVRDGYALNAFYSYRFEVWIIKEFQYFRVGGS